MNINNVKTPKDINDANRNLDSLVNRRKFLDCYLNVTGYDLSDVRTYILSRLQSLSENLFYSEENKNHETPKGLPSDRDIF